MYKATLITKGPNFDSPESIALRMESFRNDFLSGKEMEFTIQDTIVYLDDISQPRTREDFEKILCQCIK